MRKRIFAILMVVMILSVSLIACSDAQGNENAKQDSNGAVEKVELTVWAEQDNFEMMEKMVESFKQKYAGQAEFVITLVDQKDAKTKDALVEDVHNGADVFSMPDDQLLGLIAAGVLSPVQNATEISNANVAESVSAASYNGVLYAYPYTADNGYFLYYDKDYFSEEDVKSLDKILEVAAKSGKKFSMEFDSGWYLYSFFGKTGMQFGLNEDGVTNFCNWNSTEGAIKGTDIAKSLLNITKSPAFYSQSDNTFVDSVKSGQVIAGISGVWNAVGIREALGDDYGACKLPTYTCAGQQVQMSSFTGYKMMGVNAYSDNLEWAHKLADWFTNEENQTIRFEERNQGPSNINAASSEVVKEVPAIRAVIDQSQYGNLQRVGNMYWDPCTDFANVIMSGNTGGKDLQKIMDELVDGITASTVQ